MPRRANTTTITIQNITPEQKADIDAIRETTGESVNALFKRLAAEEAKRLGIHWAEDDVREWVPNDD